MTEDHGLEVDALLASLAAWSADHRTREAATARARERWLRQQSEEAATWVGVLVDLAEREQEVTLDVDGVSSTGQLVGVGEDLCVLAHSGGSTLVALPHVRALRLVASHRVTGSDRRPALTLTFADALTALAADRSPARLTLVGGGEVRGTLVAVGVDVLTLRGAGRPRGFTYVPLPAVATCSPTA